MTKIFRYFLFFVCAAQFLLAIVFFLQLPLATSLWPFEGTTPLTYILIASFYAAAAASTLWVAVSENYGALAGIGLDYLTIFAPAAYLSIQLGSSSGNTQLTAYGFACVFGALFGLGMFLWGLRQPLPDVPPMPALVRWSFVAFVAALLLAGVQLILQVPNVIPWSITPTLSVIIGWMFLGAAAYFVYGLLRPSWLNAAGQLIGFLAYDVVLIGPFLSRLPTVAPEHRTSQIIYTVVVVYSGLLALYYLIPHRTTRLSTWRLAKSK
jgi:hypothetical protein